MTADAPTGPSTDVVLRRWMPLYVGLQLVAFVVVLALDPSGFDRCEAAVGRGTLVAQSSVATIALVTLAAVAIRRLRGRPLAVALLLTGCAVGGWVLLLDGSSQSC